MNTSKTLKNILSLDFELDNQNTGTDKNTVHSYIENFYENEFFKYQNKKINLLEIGIYHGGSLDLWSKYFSNAEIYGFDITDLNILERYRNLNNVKQVFADAYDYKIADSLPNFDIIIDDGPHTLETQIKCLEIYLPKLNDGGVLIIEDIQHYEHLFTLDQFVPEVHKKNIEHVDLRNKINRFDDILFVVRK
jgi:cephalosporin hydroxylase